MQTKVPRKPQPSRPPYAAAMPPTSASAATTKRTAEPALPVWICAQTRKPTASIAATRPSLTDRARARCRMSPSVLSATNIAPWVRKRNSVTSPPSSPIGLSRVKMVPVKSLVSSIGTPRTMLANATPHRNAGTYEPTMIARSHHECQAASGRWWRYSNARPRTISATRISSSGR